MEYKPRVLLRELKDKLKVYSGVGALCLVLGVSGICYSVLFGIASEGLENSQIQPDTQPATQLIREKPSELEK